MPKPPFPHDFSVPIVDGAPDDPRMELPPAKPKKRGKPKEQYETEHAAYCVAMRSRHARIAAYNRRRATAVGITQYQWMAPHTPLDCARARQNDGKIFSYATPPPGGHPAEGECDATDWCRCFAKAVVPGLS